MCIYLFKNEIYTAEEDIPCVKVFCLTNNVLISPFVHSVYEIGKTYLLAGDMLIEYDDGLEERYYIAEGFHSYEPSAEAIDLLSEYIETRRGCKAIVCECVIPKGAQYSKGFHNSVSGFGRAHETERGYVSNQIRISNILNNKKDD